MKSNVRGNDDSCFLDLVERVKFYVKIYGRSVFGHGYFQMSPRYPLCVTIMSKKPRRIEKIGNLNLLDRPGNSFSYLPDVGLTRHTKSELKKSILTIKSHIRSLKPATWSQIMPRVNFGKSLLPRETNHTIGGPQ